MNKHFLSFLSVLCLLHASAQRGFGFDLGMSTNKTPMLAAKYYIDKNAPSIGFSYQIFNDALGKKESLKPGSTSIGDGDYYYSVDIGYTRVLSDKFSIEAELSIGTRKYYQNLRDDNSSSGGYHRITDTKSVVGGGGLLFYNLNDIFSLFAGYNSLRDGTFGVEIRLFKNAQY